MDRQGDRLHLPRLKQVVLVDLLEARCEESVDAADRKGLGSPSGRGRGNSRRQRDDDHAQPARRSQRLQQGNARGTRWCAQGGARSRRPRGRAHRRRARVLRRAGPRRVPRGRGGHRRSSARHVPPQPPRDPCAREARDRRRQRAGRGRGHVVRLRVRYPDRGRLGELRSRLHQHRARPRLGRRRSSSPGSWAMRGRSNGWRRAES